MTPATDDHYQAVIPRSTISLSPSCGSMLALSDGRIMLAWGAGAAEPVEPLRANYSSDGGRTWTDPVTVKKADGSELDCVIGPSLVRISARKIGLAHTAVMERGSRRLQYDREVRFHVSEDEGETWSEGVEVAPYRNRMDPLFDHCIRLSSGRLVIPFYQGMGPIPTVENPGDAQLFGERFSNVFSYGMCFSLAFYSDDEGVTWQRSVNEVHATIDRGMGGSYSMVEPVIAELADGRLLMLGNTALGRVFRSYSADGGESWLEAEPTELVLRRSPLCLKRIPDSDDVLVIWSQISPWEAMQGVYRHRLSCAVSGDGGVTWKHHKNLESLDDVDYLESVPVQYYPIGANRQPLDRVRYHRAPGPLRLDHPYCLFHEGNAIVIYGRGVLGDPDIITHTYGMDFEETAAAVGFDIRPDNPSKVLGHNKVHVIPVDWFYR